MRKQRVLSTSKFPPIIRESVHGRSVVWQPGDGTRYTFVFSPLGALLRSEGVPNGAVMGTILDTLHGAMSLPFEAGDVLHMTYAREKLPSLYANKDEYPSSSLWAFVIIANWLYGDLEYGDTLYAGMAEMYRFENRLETA